MGNLLNAIPNTVGSLPSQFSTHQLIIALAKKHQHTYIEALHEHLNSERPFQALHSKIGKHLRRATTIVRLVSAKYKDADIFRQISDNALWERVV